jgi:hypothetical protein
MDVKAICDHLSLARAALGPEHPLSARIRTIERNLTPGDSLWHGDAVSTQTDLLVILSELERAQAGVPSDVNEAIEQISDAIELL